VMDSQKGLFLNEQPIKLKGVCNHHDAGPVGTAVPDDVLRRRMQILKDMGCNAIRTSHNITSRDQVRLADEMGLILVEEAFDCWQEGKRDFDYHLYYNDWWKKDLRSMVLRDRNSPSIIFWSVGNEIPQKGKPEGVKLAQELVDFLHELDPTRLVSCGNNGIASANASGVSDVFDIVGYNSGGGSWNMYEEDKATYPDRIIWGSEVPHTFSRRGAYKTTNKIRRDKVDPSKSDGNAKRVYRQNDLAPEEVFSRSLTRGSSSYDNHYGYVNMRESWRRTRDLPYVIGEFRWTGFDYIGECGANMSSEHGIIDVCGFPKDSYYFYQSQWTDKPMVHLLPHWSWPELKGKEIPVWAYSNAEEVELFLNGKSLGRKKMDRDEMKLDWMVGYEPGTLEAKAYSGGKLVASTLHVTASEPDRIRIKTDRAQIQADQADVVHVVVEVLDKNGNLHPRADNLVEFKVTGPARIIGTGNGNPQSQDPYSGTQQHAFGGLCMAIVQSTGDAGEITITATSAKLKSTSLVVGSVDKIAAPSEKVASASSCKAH
jgi:beta-galactosidase